MFNDLKNIASRVEKTALFLPEEDKTSYNPFFIASHALAEAMRRLEIALSTLEEIAEADWAEENGDAVYRIQRFAAKSLELIASEEPCI